MSPGFGRACGQAVRAGKNDPAGASLGTDETAGVAVFAGDARPKLGNGHPLPSRSVNSEVMTIARSTRARPRRKAPTSKRATAPAQALLALAEKILEDGKAEDMVAIDLQGKSDIADYLLVATGRSQRQIMALAQRLLEGLKAAGHGKLAAEGMRHGEWVLIDAGDVVVHLFKPEARAYYNLEKMWGEALSEAVGHPS